ncbi:MAG: MBL fold metallo-hydrolase [Nitrospinaceae bacterium]
MQFSVLSSGSKGNSLYVEANGTKILLDAGLSAKHLTARLASIGRQPGDLDAVFLTHEHSDHVRGVGPLVRKHNLPLFSTEGTYKRIRHAAGRIPAWTPIRAEEPVTLGGLVLEPYSTPHDAEESVAFVIRHGPIKLGHVTDLGCVTPRVKEKLAKSDALLLEANHDIQMLEAGPYPWPLKQRIKSELGHLSNEACGDLLAAVAHSRLRLVVLMHLSETNNHPDIADITARQALGESRAQLILARQDQPTKLIPLD